ncbi:hypothetical protein PSN45_002358, partial [Yamadazyma tenuis]|uniref:uncharacterized protein n=1 Tax=Candida tenuis TaxID=2315449 RepID=UPI00279C52FA
MLFRLILIWYLSLPFVLGSTGCSPPSTSSGLSVDYFDDVAYKNMNTAYLNVIDSMTPDYTNNGVSDINFSFTGITQVTSADADSTTDYRDVYGRSTNVVKFGLRLSGYFLAPGDGTYTFTFTEADDSIAMTLGGATQDLDCCIGAKELSLGGSLKANGTTGGGSTSSKSKVSMITGNYYPVKIIYYNRAPTAAGMTLQVTYPDGSTHTDDIPWYYSTADDEDLCTTTTTTNIWTGTDTEYFTVTGSDGDVTVTIEVPETTTTTTDPWTGTDTTTITHYPSNRSDPVTVEVKTPESTTTTTHIGSVATTYTVTPSNPSDPVTVVVETTPAPSSPSSSSVKPSSVKPSSSSAHWLNSTTSISSSNTPAPSSPAPSSPAPSSPAPSSPAPSSPAPSSPAPSGSVITITTPWTGSATSFYTTTGTDGKPTVYKETPIPTITTPWTGSTTSFYTTTGTDGKPTVYKETPIPTITTPWTGSITSSYTTTGADGKPTVVVETPVPVVTEKDVTTIILPCTCKEPSTTTTTGDN